MRSEIPMTDKAHAIADGIKTVPAAGDTTTWLRDEATGLVTNKVYADGKGPTYTYTPDGKLATRTWARGIVTTYSYDDNGALTNTVYSDGTPSISLAYNRAGRQIEAHDAAGVTTFLYDEYGSLTNETVRCIRGALAAWQGEETTNVVSRFYDNFGRDAGYALNGIRQSTLAYDPATGRLASIQIPSEQSNNPNNQTIKQFSWNYLAGSDLKSSLAYPNGLTASWQYDANGQLLQVCNATATNTISQYDYVYDAAGRRINVSKSGTAFAQADSIAYGYNARSELTNAVAAVDSDYRYAYDFDDVGNRESASERGTNSVYAANNLNQYTAVDDFTPQFDDDGNQTLIKTATGVWQVSYNGENRPVFWSNGTTNIAMKFDRMGRRVEYLETVDNATNTHHRFVYDGYLCLQRLNAAANNSIDLMFAWDPAEPVATRPLMIEKPGVCTLHVTHDGNKNVSDLLFFNGGSGVAAHYEYAPFGALIASTRSSTSTAYDFRTYNPFRFSSEYADDALGLVYYNYRHYEPVMGRWLSRDPIDEVGGLFLYSFCMNNPLLSFDSMGLFTPLQLIAGSVLGGVIGGLSAAITGGDILAGISGGLVSGACSAVCPAAVTKCATIGGAVSGFISGVRSANEKKLCGAKWHLHVVASVTTDVVFSRVISGASSIVRDGITSLNPMRAVTITQTSFFGLTLENVVDDTISSITVGVSSTATSTVLNAVESAAEGAKALGNRHEEVRTEIDVEF